MIIQLLNGCMLLVTTLPLLLQLLTANHFKLTELQILVSAILHNTDTLLGHLKIRTPG